MLVDDLLKDTETLKVGGPKLYIYCCGDKPYELDSLQKSDLSRPVSDINEI